MGLWITLLSGLFKTKDFSQKMYILDYLQFLSQETLGAPRPESHLHEFVDGGLVPWERGKRLRDGCVLSNTTRFNAHRKARPAPAHAVTPALAQSPWDTGDAGWEPSRALPPAIRSRTDSPPFGELDHPPHQGPPQRLTDVVCAVADVGRDLFHTLVVQHGLLLCESAGELLVDSSARESTVSQQPY